MKLLIIIVSLFMACSCFAEVVLYRYTDKITGDERGICYSDKDGNSAIKNDSWKAEIISEKDKSQVIATHKAQLANTPKAKSELEQRIEKLEDDVRTINEIR